MDHEHVETIEDRPLECVMCHQPFLYSVGEQRFFAERGFKPPKRCPSCRRAKAAQRTEAW